MEIWRRFRKAWHIMITSEAKQDAEAVKRTMETIQEMECMINEMKQGA